MVRGLNHGGGEIFRACPVRPCKMGTGSFPGVNRPGRGADHPPHPSAVENEKAIPLIPLWALGRLLQGDLTLLIHYIGGNTGCRASLYAVNKSAISACLESRSIAGHSACSLEAVVTGLTNLGKKLPSQAIFKLIAHDHIYRCAPISADSVSGVLAICGLLQP
jgi:hypothetical protein